MFYYAPTLLSQLRFLCLSATLKCTVSIWSARPPLALICVRRMTLNSNRDGFRQYTPICKRKLTGKNIPSFGDDSSPRHRLPPVRLVDIATKTRGGGSSQSASGNEDLHHCQFTHQKPAANATHWVVKTRRQEYSEPRLTRSFDQLFCIFHISHLSLLNNASN